MAPRTVASPLRAIVSAVALLAVVYGTSPVWAGNPAEAYAELARPMIPILEKALAEEKEFVRIHAAEALVEHGVTASVVEVFGREAEAAPPIQRVGVWRTLAAASSAKERAKWVARLREVMLTPGLSDRIHAAESLAKLGVSLPDDRAAIDELARNSSKAHSCHAIWLLALSGDATAEGRLCELLASDDPIARLASGYILGRLPKISEAAGDKLLAAANSESTDSPACGYLVAAAYLRATHTERPALKTRLVERLTAGTASERYAAALAIGEQGSYTDSGLLAPLLKEPGDIRVGAAQGTLRISRNWQRR